MRIFPVIVAGLWAVAALPCCQRVRSEGPPRAVPVAQDGRLELKLMSFNVRYENPQDLDRRTWRERVVSAVRMIRDESPDVIGVQEALHGQAADLWASLPDYEFFGIGRDDGIRHGEYAGILFRRDRFEADLVDRGTFWLSASPSVPGSMTWGNEIPRVAAWVRLVDRASQRGFYVFNTHWDHRNQESREQAALLLARRIDERQVTNEPVVLLGDFNARAGNPGLAYLTGRSVMIGGKTVTWRSPLLDTFDALHAGRRDRTTLHFWRGTVAGDLKVDHILVSAGARVLAAEIRDRDHPMLSDHFPVTAEVIFP